MTRIKFCGLKTREDVLAVNRLKPDYAGFVLSAGFKRSVSLSQAGDMVSAMAPGICRVGVFVNEPLETVLDCLCSGLVQAAQLHGAETDEYVARLQQAGGCPVIKFFALKAPQDARRAESSPADYVLLDSGTGTGKAFDWSLAAQVSRPFFLAGGLGSGNVAQAIRACRPFAVDVSSGIETQGRKDFEKMAAFMAAVNKEDSL